MIDLKNLGLPDHIFGYFRISFHDLLLKNQAAEVSHNAVTLRMTSNNRRSAPVMDDHLPIEEASGGHNSNRRNFAKKVGYYPASNVTLDFFIWVETYLCTKPIDKANLRLLPSSAE